MSRSTETREVGAGSGTRVVTSSGGTAVMLLFDPSSSTEELRNLWEEKLKISQIMEP